MNSFDRIQKWFLSLMQIELGILLQQLLSHSMCSKSNITAQKKKNHVLLFQKFSMIIALITFLCEEFIAHHLILNHKAYFMYLYLPE